VALAHGKGIIAQVISEGSTRTSGGVAGSGVSPPAT